MGMGMGMGHGPGMHGPMGIPPHVAAKLGLSPELTKQVRDASLDANEALITLEADLKRAQLELERALGEAKPDESKVMQKLELISKAELAVRKNRLGLMLKVRKLLGPETWEKLQAEMPGPGPGFGGPGGPGRFGPPQGP
jgi:Spy/CpxP family protein refolding chaperone